MSITIADDVLGDIRRAYGSLDHPDFSFVGSALARRPYDDLVRRLDRAFKVEEITDPDDDVSFGYVVAGDGQRWHLSLSMVGPYALLLRLRDDGGADLVAGDTTPISPAEAELKDLLVDRGLRLLDRDTLREPIRPRLFSADAADVRLHQALFTDGAALPWEEPFSTG